MGLSVIDFTENIAYFVVFMAFKLLYRLGNDVILDELVTDGFESRPEFLWNILLNHQIIPQFCLFLSALI